MTCCPGIFRLTEELGHRTDRQSIHWLLSKVRPDLVLPPKPKTRPVPDDPFAWPRDYKRRPWLVSGGPPSEPPWFRLQLCCSILRRGGDFRYPNGFLLLSGFKHLVEGFSKWGQGFGSNKAERLVAGAAAYGSQLVVFPEAFAGGYPRGMMFDAATGTHSPEENQVFQKYYASAVNVPGPEVDWLAKIASQYKVHLVMGVVERVGFYLYSTVIFFDSFGRYLGKHPKLLPLASESPVWRFGEKFLPSVYETTVGRIGGLVCWDNKMPDLRTQLYAKGIELYCAPTAEAREIGCSSMIHIALEGGCFILSANQFYRRNDYPLQLDSVPGDSNDATSLDVICAGGSVIFSASGTILAGPNFQGESLISADLDLGEIDGAKLEFGGVGHNAEEYTVGWSTNRSNPELFTTTMKTKVSEAPYGPVQDCFTTTVKTEVPDYPNELLL